MRDIVNIFGSNAGKIWKALDKKDSLEKDKIKKITNLKENDFYSGIGWLAREDKISRYEDDYYKLSNTNLEDEIGRNAGLIWRILDIWDEAGIESIKNLTNLDKKSIYAALGWLAKEDKIIKNRNKYRLK